MSNPSQAQIWQLRWHEILNDYPDPDGGESVTPDPLLDMDSDYRLHFNLWQVPREARRRAFAILPCGDDMLARVDRLFSERRMPLEPEQAVSLLRTGLQRALDAGVPALPAPDMQIDVISDWDTPLLDAFKNAGNPFCEVTDRLSDGARAHHGATGFEAYFFLSEPLSIASDPATVRRIGCDGHCAAILRTPICRKRAISLRKAGGPWAGTAKDCSFSTGAGSSGWAKPTATGGRYKSACSPRTNADSPVWRSRLRRSAARMAQTSS